MADTPSMPPLPSGSIDFDKIHAAARKGHDLDKAIASATFVHPDKEAAADAQAAAEPDSDAEATPAAKPAETASKKKES